MIFLAALVLLALGAGNRVLGKSWIYPPAAYCALWAALIAGVGLSGDAFDPVSFETLLIYTLGGACFAGGGFLAMCTGPGSGTVLHRTPSLAERRVQERVLLTLVVILVMLLPFYRSQLMLMSDASGIADFWRGLRIQMVSSALTGDVGLGAFAYYLSCASLLTLIAASGSPWPRTGRLAFPVTATLTIAALSATASRLGILMTLFGLFAVLWHRDRGLRPLHAAGLGAGVLTSFAAAALLLEKGADRTATLMDNLTALSAQFRLYVFGGLVAFDKIVQDPPVSQAPYLTLRPFYAVARALGGTTPVPELVQPVVLVPEPINVYTIYYPYYTDFGTSGLCVIMAVLGYAVTAAYRKAVDGSQPARVISGLAFGYLILSNSGEGFLIGLSFWVQAALFLWLFYSLPTVLGALRRFIRPAVRRLASPDSPSHAERRHRDRQLEHR